MKLPADIRPDTTRQFAMVAHLVQDVQSTADYIVARARAVHWLGATAEAYRLSALEMDHQAERAERLLFGQAVETLRAAAATCRLTADALEIIEGDGELL